MSLTAAALLGATLSTAPYSKPYFFVLLVLVLVALCGAIGLHVYFLLLIRRQHFQTADTLHATEREFKSIFESVRDSVLILNDDADCLQANPAAQMLLSTDCNASVVGTRFSSFLARAEDFFGVWNDILRHGNERGEITLIANRSRSVFIEYTAEINYLPGKHIIVLRDITRRKIAEEQVARNLALAESARSEADALRETTLALTQNLSMDYVLDTLLESLVKVVPCEAAAVLLCETDSRLFVARDFNCRDRNASLAAATVRADHNEFISSVIRDRNAVLMSDSSLNADWAFLDEASRVRSWLGVPLIASEEVLGLLSLGDRSPNAFTEEHVRLAKSLAIPAAVAIQNARLYERASIYGMELEQRGAELDRAEQALRLAREGRGLSD